LGGGGSANRPGEYPPKLTPATPAAQRGRFALPSLGGGGGSANRPGEHSPKLTPATPAAQRGRFALPFQVLNEWRCGAHCRDAPVFQGPRPSAAAAAEGRDWRDRDAAFGAVGAREVEIRLPHCKVSFLRRAVSDATDGAVWRRIEHSFKRSNIEKHHKNRG
jgi:hypothetical protein